MMRKLKSTFADWSGAGLPVLHERRLQMLERFALGVFVFVAGSHIISSAHLGIGVHHSWRQSDVYGYILGFMHARGFAALEVFNADLGTSMYEVPIYHYLIAKASMLTGADPLVATRYFNLGCWALAAFAGYSLCRFVGGGGVNARVAGRVAGLVFVYLFASAKLFLYYYSMPMPDAMGIALSLAGVVVLLRGGGRWKGALRAAPLLILAAFTKSPIAFVFAAFYGIYILIDPSAAALAAGPVRPHLHARLYERYKPFIALGIVLIACAILADNLRSILSDVPRRHWAIAGNPQLYFGAWDARTSAQFWQTLWARLNNLGLPYGYLFAAAAAAALALKRDRRLAALISAAAGAYLLAWLVFQLRNAWHDYYQMPALALILAAIAVSIARICAWLREKLPAHVASYLAALALAAAIAAAGWQAVFGKLPGSAKPRDNLYAGIAYALRGETVFLHVVSPGKLVQTTWPGLGGFLSTRFRRASHADFEADCDAYLARYAAVVVEGGSECLRANKPQAKYFIEDDGLTFYLAGPPQ